MALFLDLNGLLKRMKGRRGELLDGRGGAGEGGGEDEEGYSARKGSWKEKNRNINHLYVLSLLRNLAGTGLPRLRECRRQVEAVVASNSNNKIHQTWEWPHRETLYMCLIR